MFALFINERKKVPRRAMSHRQCEGQGKNLMKNRYTVCEYRIFRGVDALMTRDRMNERPYEQTESSTPLSRYAGATNIQSRLTSGPQRYYNNNNDNVVI